MGKYDDIINEQWPKPSSRIRMPIEERAKIFMPFSALKGYDEAIANKDLQELVEMEDEYGTWE